MDTLPIKPNGLLRDSRLHDNRLRGWEVVLLFLGLLLFAGQAFFSSSQKSAAFDEEYHVAAGYAYLKTGDFRLSQDHPPLINLLSAVPLLLRRDVALPLDTPAWQQGDYFNFAHIFLWEAQEDPQSILEGARWPVIVLGTVLTAVLFWWARQMVGVWAGWLALALAVFDPNLIANSRLVTTDLGVTCFLLMTMWRLWHWLARPSPLNLLLTGLFAGLSMTAKYTGLLVWPMLVGVIIIERLQWRERRYWWSSGQLPSLVGNLLLLALAAYLVVWAVYCFDVSPFPGTAVPFPASFYPYRVWQTYHVIENEPLTAYLLGQTARGGWWYYFPVALAVKTSLPMLILTLVGTVVMFKTAGWRPTAVLWLPPLFFLLVAMAGSITIGYRHILPALPFAIMLASYTGQWVSSKKSPVPSCLLVLLLLWHAVGTVRLFPHQESFFNELAGGAARGGEVLADSNLDWGQDLIALQELMARQNIPEVYLAYFGTAVPESYNIRYRPIPGFLGQVAGAEVSAYNPYTPLPGWYAISQTSLQLGLMQQNVDIYTFFQDRVPALRAGHSINLYHITYPEQMPIDRRVVVGTAVSDLSPQALGIVDGRRLITKWTANDATRIIPFTEPFTPPPDWQPVAARFAPIATLMGYALAHPQPPGTAMQLTLFWQWGSGPVPMPAPTEGAALAAFVHLTGADPAQIVAQYDGWDTAVTTLEPGDIISQTITLTPPPDIPPGDYYLRVGLYSPQTGQRFPLSGKTDDFVTLGPIVVEIGD